MKRTQYTAEFKTEAVKQILEKGHPATEVSSCLGVLVGLLYTWARNVRGFSEEPPPDDLKALRDDQTQSGAKTHHRRARHPKKGHRVLC